MAAVIHLRSAQQIPVVERSTGTAAPALRRPAPTRPRLHVVHGGASAEAARMRRLYLRRRLLAVALVALVLVMALAAGRVVVAAWTDPVMSSASGAANLPAAEAIVGETYLVAPGDSLWSIAGRVAPESDRRVIVDRIVAANSNDAEQLRRGDLRPGQVLQLPG